MLYVMEPPEGQQWGSVVDLMRQEARQEASDRRQICRDRRLPRRQPPRSISAKARAATESEADHRRPLDLVLVLGSSSSGEVSLVTFAGKSGASSASADHRAGGPDRAEIDAISRKGLFPQLGKVP